MFRLELTRRCCCQKLVMAEPGPTQVVLVASNKISASPPIPTSISQIPTGLGTGAQIGNGGYLASTASNNGDILVNAING
jgi:hypothetical protein